MVSPQGHHWDQSFTEPVRFQRRRTRRIHGKGMFLDTLCTRRLHPDQESIRRPLSLHLREFHRLELSRRLKRREPERSLHQMSQEHHHHRQGSRRCGTRNESPKGIDKSWLGM